MYAWRRWPGSIWDAFSGPSDRSRERERRSKRRVAWHRDAGGGEQAALGECLLAAMDAADRVPGAADRLAAILDDARRETTPPSRSSPSTRSPASQPQRATSRAARDLCEAADLRMEAASHFITELDRTDARWVRQNA